MSATTSAQADNRQDANERAKPHGLHFQQLRGYALPIQDGLVLAAATRPADPSQSAFSPPGPRLHLDGIPRQTTASVALEPRPRRETARHSARLTESAPCWFLSYPPGARHTLCGKGSPGLFFGANQRSRRVVHTANCKLQKWVQRPVPISRY